MGDQSWTQTPRRIWRPPLSRTTFLLLGTLIFTLVPGLAWAAVGCSLSNPDEDIAAFFPEVESYSTHFVSFERQAPKAWEELPGLLGDPLDTVWETIDIPYSLYKVNGPSGVLGYVFGTNQRGQYSNLQVIVALDSSLQLLEVRLQKIRSPYYRRFENTDFLRSLSDRSLGSYLELSACYRRENPDCRNLPIADPTKGGASIDFRAILRGLAKLHLVSTLLLKPGEHPNPRDRAARAEWIGNPGGPKSSPAATGDLAESRVKKLSPQSLVLDLGDGRVIPEDTFTDLGLVRLNDGAILPNGRGDFRMLNHAEAFALANRTLFGKPLLKDSETGSLWSLDYEEALVGPRAGETLSSKRIPVRRWEEVSRKHPITRILQPVGDIQDDRSPASGSALPRDRKERPSRP